MTRLYLTHDLVANKIGVSRSVVSRWFRGIHFPRPRSISKLIRVLKMDYEKLVIDEFNDKPKKRKR